ncbi:MAG: hypothetical protein LUG89_00835 [Methanosphaera sp.]|nr:hypothetical protein [Methanosphaera sp.]
MKRSRLRLFRTTSLTISLLAVILLLITVFVIAYMGVASVTDTVTTTVDSGSSYDQLNQIKSHYNNLTSQYDDLNERLGTSPDTTTKTTFNEGKIKLSEANQTIAEIESSINNGESQDDINDLISTANSQLEEAEGVYNNIST